MDLIVAIVLQTPKAGELNRISQAIVHEAFVLHRDLGSGMLESVYEQLLQHRLRKRGLSVDRQLPIPIEYDSVRFDAAFRLDLLVEKQVVVEIKCVDRLHHAHRKQLLTYLRLTNTRLGLLLNFSDTLMKRGIVRVANQFPD